MSVISLSPSALTEDARLAALARYDVMDTAPEEAFDRVTRLAQKIFRTKFATISLLDSDRQWFKSRQCLDVSETPRSDAICNVTIRLSKPLIVPDALADPAYARFPPVSGVPFIRFYAGAPIVTPDGYALGALCVMDTEPRSFDADEMAMLVDLAAIVVDQLELRLLADTDALTGAMSRRAFRDLANREIDLAHRHRQDFSLLALDLDHFKRINDTHGHAAGDKVLVETVKVFKTELRTSDAIARLGGEEFAIILPHTGPDAALEVAERLRRALAGRIFEAGAARFPVTASFGVVSIHDGAERLEDLLRLGDEALYRAKAEGRNCCIASTARKTADDRTRVRDSRLAV